MTVVLLLLIIVLLVGAAVLFRLTVGAWSLLVLFRPDVKGAFDAQARNRTLGRDITPTTAP